MLDPPASHPRSFWYLKQLGPQRINTVGYELMADGRILTTCSRTRMFTRARGSPTATWAVSVAPGQTNASSIHGMARNPPTLKPATKT